MSPGKKTTRLQQDVLLADDNVAAILTIVRQIPRGKVATYGQVAVLAGLPRNARQVGFVLRNMPAGLEIPWYRVVNSRGEISDRGDPAGEECQQAALESEGVVFDDRRRISLRKFRWN